MYINKEKIKKLVASGLVLTTLSMPISSIAESRIVKAGETMESISLELYGDEKYADLLYQLNWLDYKSELTEGQEIDIDPLDTLLEWFHFSKEYYADHNIEYFFYDKDYNGDLKFDCYHKYGNLDYYDALLKYNNLNGIDDINNLEMYDIILLPELSELEKIGKSDLTGEHEYMVLLGDTMENVSKIVYGDSRFADLLFQKNGMGLDDSLTEGSTVKYSDIKTLLKEYQYSEKYMEKNNIYHISYDKRFDKDLKKNVMDFYGSMDYYLSFLEYNFIDDVNNIDDYMYIYFPKAKKLEKREYVEATPTPTIEPTATPTPIPTATPVVTPTVEPTIVPTEEPIPTGERGYVEYFDIINDRLVNKCNMTMGGCLVENDTIVLHNSYCAMANIYEIDKFINGFGLEGSKIDSTYSYQFLDNETDLLVVKHFEKLREDVLDAMYSDNDIDKTKELISKFSTEYYNFVYLGMNAENKTFAEISEPAKYVIILMGTFMMELDSNVMDVIKEANDYYLLSYANMMKLMNVYTREFDLENYFLKKIF